MERNIIHLGDCLDVLKTLPDNSIDCCVTSPPYYALRDYGIEGQLGLENTPEEYIAKMTEVFMEVYRVLKPEGTLWLNIGDSYNSAPKGNKTESGLQTRNYGINDDSKGRYNKHKSMIQSGIKNKDLIGIPWALATSLRNPFYKGKIKKESDRRWLGAIIDGEGCITGTIHTRKDGSGDRTSIFVNVTNSNIDLLNECERIYPFGKRLIHQKNGKEHFGEKDIFRWNIFGCKAMKDLFQELYPYLIAKKTQCLLAYNFCLIQETAKKDGHTPKKEEVNKKRKLLISLISLLNKGEKIEIPDWCIEPPTLHTQGWYLRQDIIWAKGNPMPESVTDRCTKSHEYIFLLSKSQKYYFDHEAIQEPAVSSDDLKRRIKNGVEEWKTDKAKDTYAVSGTGRSRTELYSKKKMPKFGGNKYGENDDTHFSTYSGNEWQPQTQGEGEEEVYVRNKRDVWQVNVKPCKEAHFATYPPDLVRPCILAGCPEGGVVLDPFMGSGTTALVAKGIGRDYIGIELNPEYKAIAERRLFDKFGLFL